MNNTQRTKEYFDKNFDTLRKVRDAKQADITIQTSAVLKDRLTGMVLDVGGGGRIDYALDDVRRVISVDMSFRSMAGTARNGKVDFVAGDAMNLGIKEGVFDRVVLLHTLHHLAGNSLSVTRKNVSRCIGEAGRALKSGGKILIVDAFCSGIAQKIEEALFAPTYAIFTLFAKPMVHYVSFDGLVETLREAGFEKAGISHLDTADAMLSPFSSSFGIPFKYTPLAHILIEAVKL